MKYEPNAPTAKIWRVLLGTVGVLLALLGISKLTGTITLAGVCNLVAATCLIVLAVRGRSFSST